MFLISVVSFILIELPPGDYATLYIRQLEMKGENVDQSMIDSIKIRYGTDLPLYGKYFNWMKGIVLKGDFGDSFQWNRPVLDVILERIPYSLLISIFGIVLTYVIALPLALYSAVKQYSFADGAITIFSFVGLATPSFLLVLILMYYLFEYFGLPPGGLFSQEYLNASWSLPKLLDMLKHLILPSFVIAITGTGGIIRTLRATLLDELSKDYVETARSKGLSETKLILKYPVRIALNPILSTVGWLLPAVVSGEAIVSIVANIPTVGPLLISALMSQDMYMAGSIILILSFLTLVGTLISDLILSFSDPRIRYE